MTLIGVHEMHGRVYTSQLMSYHVTDLLVVVDLCSSLAYVDDPPPSHSRQIAYFAM